MMESITYDIFFEGDWLKPGSKLKIKGKWSTYAYIHILCLGDLDDAWLICEDSKGNRHRFKPGQIKRVLSKRSHMKCQK